MDGCGTSPSMQTGSGTWTIPERSLKTGDRGRTSTRHTAHWAEEFSLEIVARGLYRGELAMGIKRSRPTLHSKSLFHRSKWATFLKFSSYFLGGASQRTTAAGEVCRREEKIRAESSSPACTNLQTPFTSPLFFLSKWACPFG
jgi:hypothetical protein